MRFPFPPSLILPLFVISDILCVPPELDNTVLACLITFLGWSTYMKLYSHISLLEL